MPAQTSLGFMLRVHRPQTQHFAKVILRMRKFIQYYKRLVRSDQFLYPSSFLCSNVNRRNSCLASPSLYYPKLTRSEGNSPNSEISEVHFGDSNCSKSQIDLLDIPMSRKISDCSTNSSLSGDDYEITELRPIRHPKVSEKICGKGVFRLLLFMPHFSIPLSPPGIKNIVNQNAI